MGEVLDQSASEPVEKHHAIQPGQKRVAVAGAATPFGKEVFRSLSQWEEIHLVLAIDAQEVGKNARDLVGGRGANVVIEEKLGAALDREQCDILLDFSHASAALQHGISALRRGISPILGGVCLSNPDLRELMRESKEANLPAFVLPSLSMGAVLLMELCSRSAQWMTDIEVVDVQPDHKHQNASAQAKMFAEQVAHGWENRQLRPHGWVGDEPTKTWEDIEVHAMRIKGSAPHQHIVIGSSGETISVRYDNHDPSSILEGVKLAIRRLPTATGVTVGLERLMFDKVNR
jgi:4-hydroxy-tetrahydrodipicolinate reductase